MSETWDYRVITHGAKVGIHAIQPNGTVPFIHRLRNEGTLFPVVKAVDDLSVLAQVKTLSPQTITIGRLTSPIEAAPHIMHADLGQLADSLVHLVLNKIAVSPELQGGQVVDYWEIVNEPAPPGVAGYQRLAQLMTLCMDRAERSGLKLGIFALNAGTPEWTEMQAMVETGVFGRARQGGHILTLHEGVFHDWPIDYGWPVGIPGAPHVPGAGCLCFRYRFLYHLLKQRGEVIPLVVSEFRFNGRNHPISASEVARRAQWYDEKFAEDYYTWAFCPFTIGPTPGWEPESYEYAYPALLGYMASVKNRANGTPPTSPPPPSPEPPSPEPPSPEPPSPPTGLPRIQYERTYVLLHPDADREWIRAILDSTAWDRFRWTIGGSADDAGIGALNVRKVIAINPDRWPGNLQQFFHTYYPGVTLYPIYASSPEELRQILVGRFI